MTKQDFDNKVELSKKKFDIAIKNLYCQYAYSNNTFKIGDIIQDHSNKIRIKKIGWARMFGGYSCCVYMGSVLKKDGSPRKDGKTALIYQNNILQQSKESDA